MFFQSPPPLLDTYNAPMAWYILVYLLLHRGRNVGYGELASALWEEESPQSQVVANKVRGAIYRFRRKYEGLADEYMTVSEGTGYGLNSVYNITTDTDLFEMYWIQARDLNNRVNRIALLKKRLNCIGDRCLRQRQEPPG